MIKFQLPWRTLADPTRGRTVSGAARRRGAVLLAMQASFLAACADSTKEDPTTVSQIVSTKLGNANSSAQVRVVHLPRLDDEWSRLATQELAGFAGYYADDAGNIIVMATNPNIQSAAEAYVRTQLSALPAPAAQYVFRVVRYDANTLTRWRDSLIPRLGSSVIMIDFDETRNQLFIGVTSGTPIQQFRDDLTAEGIPDDAFIIQQLERRSLDATLDDPVRATIAGLHVSGCSIGFNTQYNDMPAFVTASHCSDDVYGSLPDSTIFSQPGSGHQVGFEVHDENLVIGYVQFSPTGQAYVCNGCRFSDSQITQYYDSISSTQGSIARTLSYSSTATAGSLTINPNDSWFAVTNKLAFSSMTVGLPASKVGQSTGWTRGTITRTCIDVSFTNSGVTADFLCQHEASYFRQPGDSGSPVFFDSYDAPPSYLGVHLMGIHIGPSPNNSNYGIFSTIQGIEEDFNLTLKVCLWTSSC